MDFSFLNNPMPNWLNYIIAGLSILGLIYFAYWANKVLTQETKDPNPTHENTL
jgi:hypothetical protein